MHDTSVVEHDIKTAPLIDTVDKSLDISLLAHIALCGLDLTNGIRDNFLRLCKGLFKRLLRDISEDNGGTFAKEKDGSLKTNATSSTGDNGILSFQTKTRHGYCICRCGGCQLMIDIKSVMLISQEEDPCATRTCRICGMVRNVLTEV